jgi:hypothetical protein
MVVLLTTALDADCVNGKGKHVRLTDGQAR